MFRKFLLLTAAMTMIQGGVVYAADTAVQKDVAVGGEKTMPVAGGKPEAKTEGEKAQELSASVDSQVNTEERQVLLDRVVHMTSKLDKAQASHFFVMYSNYSIMSLVNNVEKDVGEAVQKCGEANPEMKTKVDSRYEGWKTTVSKAREEAKKNIDNMVAAQDYASQTEMNEIFSMVDKTRIEADTRFQRIPVSTPEACEFMLTKMDETEKTMDQILRATLTSLPNVLKKNQE
jgi:hypothetical protein